MNGKVTLEDIRIRNEFSKEDIRKVIKLHSELYSQEFEYGTGFEDHVVKGLEEFCIEYDPVKERVWICEYGDALIGFLLLKRRGDSAQLRYFLIRPEYRGIGLGNKLMELFMDFMKSKNYKTSYLWTTSELSHAAHLYKKYGYRLILEKPTDSFGKEVTEQKYELEL